MKTKTKRIFLWSGPRNISTTMMYSFAQRPDTKAYDEPLYAYYLSNTAAKEYHPDAELVMGQMECKGEKVIQQMLKANPCEVVFFKNMTHHLCQLDRAFMSQGLNVILTRDPKEMLPSFHKVIKNPEMRDVGYQAHVELASYFENNSIPFIILDSKEVLLDPEKALKKICSKANIPFYSDMLHWIPGKRSEDGIWAKHWYKNIHKSSGFNQYTPKTAPFPEELKDLLNECETYYNILINKMD